MKRIIVIGEGQTEQEFCNDVLQPHFNKLEIYLENPVIKKTHGGIVNWEGLKFQIETHLKQDKTAIVTTLIDYYGIHKHHKYPNWEDAKSMTNKNDAMQLMETSMSNDITNGLQNRFIPYIQLHEFEGLLFSDLKVFDDNFEKGEFLNYDYLVATIRDFGNPEMINDGSETAPSKRLSKIIKGYSKVNYGSLVAQEIGLLKIRGKCSRFNEWIIKLENI